MKRSLLWLSVVLSAALVAACGGADQNTTNSGGNGGSGAGTSTGGSTGGGNTGGSTGGGNTGGGNTGGATGGGGNTGGGNTGGGNTGGGNTGGGNTGGGNTGGGNTGGGNTGGGSATPCDKVETCVEADYCEFDQGQCGADGGQGKCVEKPSNCPDLFEPVCGCDLQIYANACIANSAGHDISIGGGCMVPAGMFECGGYLCTKATQYCQIKVSDIAGIPNAYKCLPLPAACGANPTCACLGNQLCGDMCMDANGAFTLTCPGG